MTEKDEIRWHQIRAQQAIDETRALRAGIRLALNRLDASLFTNAEHAQAKEILREALRDGDT